MHGQTHSWTVNHTDRRISARTDEIACVALYYPITLEWHEKKNCIWVMCFVVYWSFELCAPWFTDHLSYVLRGLLIIWVMCSVIYWSSELCAPWFTDHLSYVLRDLLIIWVMCSVVYWSFELCAPWFTDHLSYVLRGWLIIWVMCSVVYWSFARTRSVLNRIILRVLWISFFLPILWKSQSLQRWERVMYWP